MRAAYLIRCSTKKQDYDRQVRDLTRLSKEFGYEPTPKEFIYGEHITGRDDATKKDRLSIQHIKEDAEKKLFDVILVSEVSRMSRDVTSGMVYVRQLTNIGMPVYFKDIEIWTINPETGNVNNHAESALNAAFMAASKYLKSMKTQIASGRRNSLSDNQLVLGHVLFGYKKLGGKDRYSRNTIVVDEENAPIVKDIFEMYVQEGATLKSVSLAATQKHNRRFSVSGIQQMLARKEYSSGEYNITTVDPDTKEEETFTLTFEPIITNDLYEKARQKRKTNRSTRTPYPKQKTHLLSKLIKCPICGHSYSPAIRCGDKKGEKYRMINGKPAYQWRCMSRINNADDCQSHINLNDEKVSAIIWELIKKELILFANLTDEERNKKIVLLSSKIANYQNDIDNFTSQIESMEKRMSKAFEIYLDAPSSIQETAKQKYYEVSDKCQKEINSCKSKIEDLSVLIGQCMDEISFYKQPILLDEAISKAEHEESEKRKLFEELIIKIYPYAVKVGVVVLEVYAKHGVFYILLDGYQRGKKRLARYISGDIAIWQDGKRKSESFKQGKFFIINEDELYKKTGIQKSIDKDAEFNFRAVETLCSFYGWELNYDLW